MLTEKLCLKCKREFPIKMFGKHKQKKDGLRAWCKQCNREAARRWYHKDPSNKYRAIESTRNWASLNREKIRSESHIHTKRNMEELSDSYIRKCLRLTKCSATQELIEIHRIHLKIKRFIWGSK